jgi:hypothetical protein
MREHKARKATNKRLTWYVIRGYIRGKTRGIMQCFRLGLPVSADRLRVPIEQNEQRIA